jgi:iron(III) transport system ATP-binding protein
MKVELKNIKKTYEKQAVLIDVNLTTPTGKVVGIKGPSGSGKTTLLRLISGFEPPDEGQILLDGKLVSEKGWLLPPHQRKVGFVFQTPVLWPHMRIEANISYGLHGFSASEGQKLVASLAEKLQIEHLLQKYPGKLSGGEVQRVALARTLAAPFKLLLLDEPFAHLDEGLEVKILPVILERCRQQQSTLFWVSHDTSAIKDVADCWVKITDGKVVTF